MNEGEARVETDPDPVLRSDWRFAAPLALATLLGLIALYWSTFSGLFHFWMGSGTYGHSLLVVPISVWLVWRLRDRLGRTPASHSLPVAALVLLLGLGWLLGDALSTDTVKEVCAIALIGATLWTVLGGRVFRIVAFPVAYLLFTIPVWDVFVPYLQDQTARVSTRAVQMLGIPVFHEGFFITIPEGRFVVAEVCAGLRFLLATMAVASLYAYLNYTTAWRRIVFFAVAVVLSILFNWIRVVIIIVLGHLSDMQHPIIHDHISFGWVVFVAGLLVLFVFGYFFHDPLEDPPALQPMPVRGASRGWLVGSALLALGLAGAGPAGARWMSQGAVDAPVARLDLPVDVGSWTGADPAGLAWTPRVAGAEIESGREYARGEERVYLFVAFSRGTREGELLRQDNEIYDLAQWREVYVHLLEPGWLGRVPDDEAWRRVREVELQSALGERTVIWSWFYADGRFTVNRYAAKLLQLLGTLTGRPTVGVVALVAPEAASSDAARSTLREFMLDAQGAIHAVIADATGSME